MMPAARVSDICSAHADICISGSPNVMINNLQAHRAADVQICPIIGIGVTLSGSATVIVNGLQAARVTSVGMCLVPNVIVSGSGNVKIGG